MRKRIAFLLLLLCALLSLAGCGVNGGNTAPSASATPVPTPKATPLPTPTPDPIAQQIGAMGVEDKVGQLLIAGFYGTQPGEEAVAYIQDYRLGGLILFGRNVESADQFTALLNGLKALNEGQIPLFLSADQEGGMVNRMPPEVHALPSAYNAAGQGADPTGLGGALGAECAAFGLNLNFAPSLDIWSNPENTVIGKRSFGTDAGTVTAYGPAVAYGMMDAGVIPVVKHFPGHGDTAVDSHVGLPVVEKSLEELWESELLPFQAAIDGTGEQDNAQPVPAVMVGHILLSTLDDTYPATLSHAVVSGLLREEMGFAGVVVTDDMTMGAITQSYGLGEAAVLAVEAGCDLLLVCHEEANVTQVRTALLEAVDSGRISQERLDESVHRILSAKAGYGLSNDPVPAPDLTALNAQVDAVSG